LGRPQSIETELAVGRSHAVVRDVIARLHLIGRRGLRDASQADVKLRKKVNIEAVRGSILQVKVWDTDPAFARELAAGFADEIHDRLASLNLEQTGEKRAVAENRMSDATIRLAKAQAAIARFRASNKLAAPEAQLGAAVTQLASLQGRLQAKRVQLNTLLGFATTDNVQVKAVQGEIVSLQAEIARAQSPSGSAGAATLAGMAAKNSEYFNLYRDERYSQVLYEIYTRYLEATTIDELSANNNISMLEPAYVDPARQFNIWAVALFWLVVLLALTSEFYILRPPVGRLSHGG
ncbi:MAG: capsule biosynthesis protein, partial [Pseudomonadota bacterium]|nr:capsule biosynthesis protein [Pseudomonadota bacterium]